MSETKAQVSKRKRISGVWFIPIVAVLLGAYMVFYTYQNQGPEITITFSTAEGIKAGETKLKARSVVIGVVTSVGLAEDLESVVVMAELDKDANTLLREDTQFWVVRPRVGAAGITGLGTILSGGYIEVAPGEGTPGRREFVGLEDVPVTPVGTPGLKFSMVGAGTGSVNPGDPIIYRGFTVGRVETETFDVDTQQVHYDAFIDAPYDDLVNQNTRFWNISGLHISTSADGVEVKTGSLESLLVGGVSFGLPRGKKPGAAVQNGASFELFPDEASVNERPFLHHIEYVLQFERSVRGLKPGAPVEYRGLPAGHVERILLHELAERSAGRGEPAAIPVLISVEPGRLEMGDSEEAKQRLTQGIRLGIGNGLRATLATGSLLTGSLYVALDEYPDAPPAEQGEWAGYPTIPTVGSGLEGLQQQASDLLAKLNDLPLEETVQELEQTIAALNRVVASEGVQTLPTSLETTLEELNRTLRQVGNLAATVEAQPSSILFSGAPKRDPEPPAGSP